MRLNAAQRAVSSAVERFVYTEDVGGSIPSPPTMSGLLPARRSPSIWYTCVVSIAIVVASNAAVRIRYNVDRDGLNFCRLARVREVKACSGPLW